MKIGLRRGGGGGEIKLQCFTEYTREITYSKAVNHKSEIAMF